MNCPSLFYNSTFLSTLIERRPLCRVVRNALDCLLVSLEDLGYHREMRGILAFTSLLLVSPPSHAQLPSGGTFADFDSQCRTNVGIRSECERGVLEAAHVAFGDGAVVCIYPAIWPVAEQIVDPPAAERPWKEVLKVLVEEKGICVPDQPLKKQ